MCLGLKHSCEFGLSRFENSVINKATVVMDEISKSAYLCVDNFRFI